METYRLTIKPVKSNAKLHYFFNICKFWAIKIQKPTNRNPMQQRFESVYPPMCHCCFKANSPLRKRRKSEGRAKDNRTMIEQRTKEYRTHIEETPFFNYKITQKMWFQQTFSSRLFHLHYFALSCLLPIVNRVFRIYNKSDTFSQNGDSWLLRSLRKKYAITDYQRVMIFVIICACLRICANCAKVGSHLNTYLL